METIALTTKFRETIAQMRAQGYAVAVYAPVDLCGVPANTIEDAMIAEADDIIDCWQEG